MDKRTTLYIATIRHFVLNIIVYLENMQISIVLSQI